MSFNMQFGGKIRQKDVAKFAKSAHWNGKIFENLIETTMAINLVTLPKLLKKNFTGRQKRVPQQPIEIIAFDAEKFATNSSTPKFVWYGHSVLLLQLNGKNLLIDPMFGDNASPIAPFKTKRFSENALDVIASLPTLDAVLLTHDHYDHIDFESIKKLIPKTKTWFVALGVSRHLERWGVSATQITEFDWWENLHFEGIELTFTPSRHFSGRGLTDRAKSLWGGWVFKTENHAIYWSGDGGYGPHFKEIGEKFGPFDWAFIECGQYNEHWHAIHMYPEEAVLAALDVATKTATPVHWGGFSLALHSWKDPIKRFYNEAKKQELKINTPKIGEIVLMNDLAESKTWWTSLR